MKNIYIILAFVLSASDAIAEVDVNIDHQADVYYLNSDKKEKVKNKNIKIDKLSEPLWIVSKGRVPFLLVPVDSKTTELSISSPRLAEQAKKSTAEELDRQLSKVMVKVLAIQKDLSKGRKFDAKTKLKTLMKDHPDLDFLNFLAASASVLDGNKSEAMEYLKAGLDAHPNFKDGKKLLKRLQEEE